MKRDFFFGLFLTVFLLVFTPFGLGGFAYKHAHIILGYGLVSTFTIVMNDVFAYHFFSWIFNEARWKVYHQIIWTSFHLLMLGITNLAYGYAVGGFPFTLLSFFKLETYVIACALIPIAVFTLIRQNYLLKRNAQTAKGITDDIITRKSGGSTNLPVTTIRFIAENNKDFFEPDTNSILWIQSQDNYVEFVYNNDGKLRKTLLRSTLNKVEETLREQPHFFRCHRTYLVNLNKIQSATGNSQGYRLVMEGSSEEIPVARPRNKALKYLAHQRLVL